MQKRITHIDKKILTPQDFTKMHDIPSSLHKSIRGYVVFEDSKGNRQGENLVVLGGREFLAEKFADLDGPAGGVNYLNYKLRYFGIGEGGATDDSNGDPVVKVGPYANDTALYQAKQFAVGNSPDGITHVDNGYLKVIDNVEILQDTHTITTDSGTIDVQAYTTIKFTMTIDENEPPASERPFEFNEAGLFAVEYDTTTGNPIINGDGSVNKVMVAHFTTTSKFLEGTETAKIEWYILV